MMDKEQYALPEETRQHEGHDPTGLRSNRYENESHTGERVSYSNFIRLATSRLEPPAYNTATMADNPENSVQT